MTNKCEIKLEYTDASLNSQNDLTLINAAGTSTSQSTVIVGRVTVADLISELFLATMVII